MMQKKRCIEKIASLYLPILGSEKAINSDLRTDKTIQRTTRGMMGINKKNTIQDW